jgi:hypothetical protein
MEEGSRDSTTMTQAVEDVLSMAEAYARAIERKDERDGIGNVCLDEYRSARKLELDHIHILRTFFGLLFDMPIKYERPIALSVADTPAEGAVQWPNGEDAA